MQQLVQDVARDLRLAFRRLLMAPGFTLFAIASLALGVGVSTAVYSAVHTLFWVPLGVPHQEQLVAVISGRIPAVSGLDFQDLRAQQSSFSHLAAATRIRTALASSEGAEVVQGEAVSGDYFTVLQLGPLHGRLLNANDEREPDRVVVLSERFWRQHMRADPAVVGRSVRLGGLPFEVVGVVRGEFRGLSPFLTFSVWIPAGAVPPGAQTPFGTWGNLTNRQLPAFAVWGRLRPGVAAGQATSEVNAIGMRLDAAFPRGNHVRRDWTIRENAAAPPESEAGDTVAAMIMTGVAVLLLVAFSNLANLALAKGTSRSEETAVRSALGASRWRLVREQAVESCVIVVLGGALGVFVTYQLLQYFTTDLPMGRGQVMPLRPELSLQVLAASLVSLLLALVVFGLWPALQGTRADVRAGLGSGLSATPLKWRLHRNLVAWQVCGCVALLLLAAMTQQVIAAMVSTGAAADYDDLAIAHIEFSLNGRDEVQSRRAVDRLLADLRMQPGIHGAAVSNALPVGSTFATARWDTVVTAEGEPLNESRNAEASASLISASPEVFDTIRLRIVRGRPFTEQDDAGSARVAVISERLARAIFRTTEVVGRTVVARGLERFTIVGVCADVDTPTRSYRAEQFLIVPWAQLYEPRLPTVLTVRTASPDRAVAIMRAAIRRVDPELAPSAIGTGRKLLQGPAFILRVISRLATALGSIAMVLAMAGLYGVLSHVVLRRTREMGIRLALGADRGRIFRLVLKDGLRPVVKGIVLGITIGTGARLAVRGWVVTDISAFEPLVFALVPVPFILAAIVACYLPAARASRVDPNAALRNL